MSVLDAYKDRWFERGVDMDVQDLTESLSLTGSLHRYGDYSQYEKGPLGDAMKAISDETRAVIDQYILNSINSDIQGGRYKPGRLKVMEDTLDTNYPGRDERFYYNDVLVTLMMKVSQQSLLLLKKLMTAPDLEALKQEAQQPASGASRTVAPSPHAEPTDIAVEDYLYDYLKKTLQLH